MKYIPLNIKTEYDLMNSLIKIDELISYAINNKYTAIGITDYNMFGDYEFISKCIKNNIKPIVGIELTIDDKTFYLYAKNYDGYISLCKIVSKNNIDSISFSDIKELESNLILVCDEKDYVFLNNIFKNIYIYYYDEKSKIEAKNTSNKTLYLPKIKYFNKEDKIYLKYIKLIQESKTIDDEISLEDNYLIENNNSEDIKTTYDFISNIDIKIPKSTLHIPVYNENSLSYLRALAKKGLEKRLNGNVTDKYKNRLIYELSIIEKMNYVDYFLIVYDFVLFAKKHNILVGPGRGSGAASLVNYALGIINIDPLKYDLIFERFLNPDRITMPDIDIDFDNLKREEVIEYVSNKYGHKNTARIVSFNTMLPKQIIRDIGRVLKYDNTLIDKLCKTIKDEKTFVELKNNLEFMTFLRKNDYVKNLIIICNKLCGLKKNTGMHAAGVVISDISLDNIMPLYKSNGVILTGYSMEYIETLGLLKMDFLSIKNLNTISNILEDIKKSGYDFDINSIDLNDQKTLDLFKNAYTSGIFQFEKQGMKNFLKLLQVNDFNTLVDAIALYRPGPRDNIDEYIARKRGKKYNYIVKELEPILSSTYGIIIYQEQVLEILRQVAGYSYSEADIVRRAMSKKKHDIIESEKSKFFECVISKGYDSKIAEELYNLIIKFAEYGFNKSHSVAYSLVAFQMAYLKVHYTSFFMKSLLNMKKNSSDIKDYLDESKLLGLEFDKININKSTNDFELYNSKLVLPFSMIKQISYSVSNEIVEERNKRKFDSFYDFMIRCYHGSINKKVVISLIECGAFDIFNINKKQYIENIDEIINYVSLCKELSLVVEEKPVFDDIDDYTDKENIEHEIKNYGFYLSFHPVTKFDRSNMVTLENIKAYFDKTITLVLFLDNFDMKRTKNNDRICFLKLSDEYKSINGVIFKDSLNKINSIEKNTVYKINAKVERRANEYQLIVYNMINIDVKK